MSARALPVAVVEKPWGRDTLPVPFAGMGSGRIGEIWFEPPPELPGLLVKYLFTSDKLSVQVHPADDQAEAAGYGPCGKDECWLVLDAEPDARLGVGFCEDVSGVDLRAAALDGSIAEMLAWHPVARGDYFYIPAGTVHSIGPGITLVEVQQTSDITFRLYDFGRPRELHLDRALAVLDPHPHDPRYRRKLDLVSGALLADGPYFRLDLVAGGVRPVGEGPALAIPLTGAVAAGSVTARPGECLLVSEDDLEADAGARYLLARSLPQ